MAATGYSLGRFVVSGVDGDSEDTAGCGRVRVVKTMKGKIKTRKADVLLEVIVWMIGM